MLYSLYPLSVQVGAFTACLTRLCPVALIVLLSTLPQSAHTLCCVPLVVQVAGVITFQFPKPLCSALIMRSSVTSQFLQVLISVPSTVQVAAFLVVQSPKSWIESSIGTAIFILSTETRDARRWKPTRPIPVPKCFEAFWVLCINVPLI